MLTSETLESRFYLSGVSLEGPAYTFAGTDGEHGTELWVGNYQGSWSQNSFELVGEFLVDIHPGPASSSPGPFFIRYSRRAVFVAEAQPGNRELWVSNSTVGGTRVLKEINPGSAGSNPRNFIPLSGFIGVGFDTAAGVFLADDGNSAGPQVYAVTQSDQVEKILPDLSLHDVTLTAVGSRVQIDASILVNGQLVPRTWVTNGTASSTFLNSSIVNRVLQVYGSPGNDQIRVRIDDESPQTLIVDGIVGPSEFDLADFDSIEMHGLSGNDRIDDWFEAPAVGVPIKMYGDAGNDRLVVFSEFNHTLMGGEGDDTLHSGPGNDSLDGGAGSNTAHYDNPDSVTLEIEYENGVATTNRLGVDHLANIRELSVSAGDSTIDVHSDGIGDIQVIRGSGGADLISVESPDAVTIIGEAGDDSLTGGAGDDLIDGRQGNDRIVGGEGSDTLNGSSNDDMLTGGLGSDCLVGGTGNDIIESDSEDVADGGTGVNAFVMPPPAVAGGTLQVFGTATSDKFLLRRSAADPKRIEVLAGTKLLTRQLFSRFSTIQIAAGFGNDTITFDASLRGARFTTAVFCGTGNDSVSGSANSDKIYGGDGNDSIYGGAGNDSLFGDAGTDRLYGDDGNDHLVGGAGRDMLRGRNGMDRIIATIGLDDVKDNLGDLLLNDPPA